MVSIVLLLVRHKLLRGFLPGDHVVVYEVHEADGVGPVPELKVDAVAALLALDRRAPFGSIVLQNELLKVEEGTLVVHSLANLHLRLPEMRRVDSLAVVTLEVLDDELADERLLEFGAVENLFLNGELDF